MNRKNKARFFLMILCIQYLLSGFNLTYAFTGNNTNQGEQDENDLERIGDSHSSPYYFPINRSTPLLTEEPFVQSSETTPKTASYDFHNEFVLTVNLDKYVFTPLESVSINVALTFNLNPSVGELVTIEVYRGFYRDFRWYDSNYYESLVPIYTTDLITDDNGQATVQFSSTSQTGIYSVCAYIGDVKSYKEFTVGEIGIFCKGPTYFQPGQDYRAAVHVVNISDFIGISNSYFNYTLLFYEHSLSQWIVLTSNQIQVDNFGYGLFNVEIPQELDNYYVLKLILCTSGGEAEYATFIYRSWDHYYYALWGGQQTTNQDKFQYVITTDKTIYSPGNTIHLRALVLEYSFMNETKRAAKYKSISLTIYNPNDLAIFWTSLTTDEHGIITYNMQLDEDSEIGTYGFEFGRSNHKYRYNVKVDYYIKPVFRVQIETGGKEYYAPRDQFYKGFVYVEYYFGQPVTGALVELKLYDYTSNLQKTVTGDTNGEGRFYFSIDLSSMFELQYSFSVEVDVIDTYGRSASVRKDYTRIPDLFAYGYLSNWAPNPEETLEYYFNVYQYVLTSLFWYWSYNPLANVSVKIDIYGIIGYPILRDLITNKVFLTSFSANTNSFGAGKIEFKLPLFQILLFDLFEIRLKVKLEDGRSTSSSYYFRYTKYSLDIELGQSSISPGNTFEFDVTFKDALTGEPCEGEGIIQVYDSNYQLIGLSNEIFSGTKSYALFIPTFYPHGQYYIYTYVYSRSNEYYGGYSYHSAHEVFTVSNFEAISFETNFTNTGRYYDEIVVQQDDIIEINGFSNVTTNFPHYLEIYKRGLLYSIQLEVISNQFSYILPIIADFAPVFTIIVYCISKSGKIYESVLVVRVEFTYDFSLETDKAIYEPGDSVTLTITPSENTTSLFSISFVDSAILDIEPEDDSELAYFTLNSYSTYISSGSSWGSGFSANRYWWAWYGTHTGGIYYLERPIFTGDWYYAFAELREPTQGLPSFEDILSEYNTEIREDILESANWIPKMLISEPINITFKLPDNIGEWTIRVVGNSLSDNNAVLMGGTIKLVQIKTFLPFFIEFELPQPIVQDDILSVKGYIYNYLGTDVEALVAISAPNNIVLNNEVQMLKIPNGFVSEVEFSVYCKEPYFQNVTLLAATEVSGVHYSDAKQLTTYIKPNGLEIINRTIGFLNATDSPLILNYTVDPAAIYHKELLSIYTDLMDISIDSWQSLIGYPYGCIEQTISKLLPTALIYDYLNQTGQLTSDLEKEMMLMILTGLSRIYNFQHSDGGWGWWQDDASKLIMTAIVVSALNQLEQIGFMVNTIALEKGIHYLFNRQKPNGAWDFEEYSSNMLEATAYILNAIVSYSNITIEIGTNIINAIDAFYDIWYNGEMNSPYAASLFYIATVNGIYENSSFNNELIQFIKDTKKVEDDYVYWESDQENDWYWRKLGNIVEITSYATWALAIDEYLGNYATIQKAVRYLLKEKNYWGWQTTADTAAAIRALTSIKQIATAKGFVDYNGSISISLNSEYPPQIFLNITEESNLPNEILLKISEYFEIGNNAINITLNGTGQICYLFQSTQILRATPIVEVPDVIEISNNSQGCIPIKFLNIDNRMPLKDLIISLDRIPENLQDPDENYTLRLPLVVNGTEVQFSIKSTNLLGTFVIKVVSISGFIQFENASFKSPNLQRYEQAIGPLIVIVKDKLLSSSNPSYSHISPSGLQSSDTIPSNISITKQLSRVSHLIPGDVITTTLLISNDGKSRQFYVIEDEIPTGTIFLADSVEISGVTNTSEITYDLYSTGIHFFIPILYIGTLEIRYQLQVDSVKNSYAGNCILWGMYDEEKISCQSVVLENIPKKYYANHSIFQDIVSPLFSNISIKQDDFSSTVQLNIRLRAEDNSGISKIRVIFNQGSGWRARTIYSMIDQEEFSFSLSHFKNVDSNLMIFFEIFDLYGNVATSSRRTIHIIEVIPYIIIGGIIGFSFGLAAIAFLISKQKERRTRKTKPTTKVSFIDSDDNIVDNNN